MQIVEYQTVQRQQINELALLVNSCTDMINQMMQVAGVMKARLQKFEERSGADAMVKAIEGDDTE